MWCPLSCSYHSIWHPTRSLSFFLSFVLSLSLSLCRFLSLSLSLSVSLLWQISFEQCHMLEGLFSDNLILADNHVLHSVPWPSHGAISIPLERELKDMNTKWKEKMKGTCVQMKGSWEDMNAHWNENERNMKGTWMEMNTNEKTGKDNERKWMHNARKMHVNERKMKENASK